MWHTETNADFDTTGPFSTGELARSLGASVLGVLSAYGLALWWPLA